MSVEAKHFIDLLSPYVHAYGYWMAFFGMMLENAGLPVPGETALIVMSFFAGQGLLKIWLVIPLTIIGDVIGDCLGYGIGRYGGRPLVEKYGRFVRIDKAKLDAAEALYKERGGRTVFASQFSSVTRLTGSIAAGLSHMPFRRFLAVDTIAAIVLVGLVGSLTFYFGNNLDAVLRFLHVFRLAAVGVVGAIVAGFLYRYYQRQDRSFRMPRPELIAMAVAIAMFVGVIYFALYGVVVIQLRTLVLK